MIGLLSVNHQTASVDVRSAFALSEAEASMLVEDWIACGFLSGAVVLSTCNRVEIYYEAEGQCPQATEQSLIRSFLANLELSKRYAHYLSTLRDEAVYRHLFRLSAGLESLVVGETQILGQIKAAYRMASLGGHCTGSLSRLFHRAFEVAKRIRHQYMLGATPLSAGSVAVDRLQELKPNATKVLIVGAGIMADAVYEQLIHYGQKHIVVYNRTRERAERFKVQHPRAEVACEGELRQHLATADAIIVATSAPSPIVGVEHLPPLAVGRVVVDLAVPRNVAPEVGKLPGVELISIDELSGLGRNLSEQDVVQIDSLIEDYVNQHRQWVEAAEIREVIAVVQEASQHLLRQELEQCQEQTSQEEYERMALRLEHFRTTYTTAIVAALRAVSQDGLQRKYSDVTRQLFTHIINK